MLSEYTGCCFYLLTSRDPTQVGLVPFAASSQTVNGYQDTGNRSIQVGLDFKTTQFKVQHEQALQGYEGVKTTRN